MVDFKDSIAAEWKDSVAATFYSEGDLMANYKTFADIYGDVVTGNIIL
jgi:hypothetical protein